MADIVDTAIGAGSFKMLVAAAQAADLVATLKGNGPFTVFAPTDTAFEKLPAGTVEGLLADQPSTRSSFPAKRLPNLVSWTRAVGSMDEEAGSPLLGLPPRFHFTRPLYLRH